MNVRKLIVFTMITLDGYYEGTNEDISWHRVDEEVNEFIIDQLKTTDTLLFGRKTFEVMENFWPTENARQEDPEVADRMSQYLKYVFSATRNTSEWENTEWIKEPVVEKIRELKSQTGKNIFVFGSGNLCKTLIKHELIDEFRLMINPVTLGKGSLFFHRKMDLQLSKTKVFGNGNVLLCYRPDR